MISGSPSVQSISLDAAPTERRTFGRGVVGRHRFLHSHPSEPNIAGRQDGSIVADPSMNMLAAEAKAARAIAESSDDGRSDIEVPTVVAKLSTVQLSKRDSEATQTDMSRFTSVADLTSPQQPQSTRSLHSATASQSDDWVVQTLSASDTGIAMLVKRAKQSMVSGKIVGDFLQQRAQIERSYGRAMQELVRSTMRALEAQEGQGRDGTFGSHFRSFVGMHEVIGANANVFADKIQEIATDSYANVAETQKRRKACKEATEKYEQEMLQSLKALAKAEQKYQLTAQDWEKALHGAEMVEMEQGFNSTPTSPLKKTLFKTQTPQEKSRAQVDEAIRKTDAANVAFNLQIAQTNRDRKDYLTHKIPSVVGNLKRIVDDSDGNLQFNLQKYSLRYEERLMADATTLSPVDTSAVGLRAVVDGIRNESDLAEYVRNSLRNAPALLDVTPEYIPRASEVKNRDVFGESLDVICEREATDVPYIVRRLTEVVERFAINAPGIYRKNGNPADVQRLRGMFNGDVDQDVHITDNMVAGENIHVISSTLKLFFRELPDPLLTRQLYEGFQQAAVISHDVIRGQQVHDLVNHLPDRNYIVLKHIVRHFLKMCQYAHITKMGPTQLALVWGTILVGGPIRQPTSPAKASPSKGSAIDLFGLGSKDNQPAPTIQNDAKILEIIIREADKMFDFE